MLPVQVEYGPFWNICRFEPLRCREIVDGREDIEYRARSENSRVEIRGENPINKAVLHKLGDCQVRPVDFGSVHEPRDEVSSFGVGQLVHAGGIGFGLRSLARHRPSILDDPDESARGGDSGSDGTTGTNQKSTTSLAGVSHFGQLPQRHQCFDRNQPLPPPPKLQPKMKQPESFPSRIQLAPKSVNSTNGDGLYLIVAAYSRVQVLRKSKRWSRVIILGTRRCFRQSRPRPTSLDGSADRRSTIAWPQPLRFSQGVRTSRWGKPR